MCAANTVCSKALSLVPSQVVLQRGASKARTTAHANPVGHGVQHSAAQGFGYGISEQYRRQLHEFDRTAPMSLHSSDNKPLYSEKISHNFGLNSPAYKMAPLPGDSHTRPANSHLAAFGCYRVVGPARISKRGDTLVAYLLRGARVELLDRDGNATPYGSMESMAEEDLAGLQGGGGGGSGGADDADEECCVGECVLVAAHVELCGSASSVDLVDLTVQSAVHHHNGHTYVSVRNLPDEAVIELDADADLRHPINITPMGPPSPPPPQRA